MKTGEAPFEAYKIYGPYLSLSENRRVICLIPIDGIGSRTTISYARYLVSIDIGELVDSDMVVDHIDNDSLNDDINNLQIITISENNKKDRVSELRNFTCPVCGKEFALSKQRSYGKINPACSRRCGGIKSHWK